MSNICQIWVCQIFVKYEFVIYLLNIGLNELNDVGSNRSSDQRPMTASLKQQQSTSSDIYCAFYWTIRWLNFIYYLIFSFSILTHFQTIFILPLLNHWITQFHAFSHFFSLLRFLIQFRTLLYFPLSFSSFRPFVCHSRDISTLLWWFRPRKPYIFWMHII